MLVPLKWKTKNLFNFSVIVSSSGLLFHTPVLIVVVILGCHFLLSRTGLIESVFPTWMDRSESIIYFPLCLICRLSQNFEIYGGILVLLNNVYASTFYWYVEKLHWLEHSKNSCCGKRFLVKLKWSIEKGWSVKGYFFELISMERRVWFQCAWVPKTLTGVRSGSKDLPIYLHSFSKHGIQICIIQSGLVIEWPLKNILALWLHLIIRCKVKMLKYPKSAWIKIQLLKVIHQSSGKLQGYNLLEAYF